MIPSVPARSIFSSRRWDAILPFFVFVIAFAIRLVVLFNTAIINPDGTIYIYQAKALHYHEYQNLTSCGVDYLSLYPILILLAYNIIPDWIFSAHFISIIFGFCTILLIFFTSRIYFNPIISAATTLLFSLNPIFTRTSVDIIKDPVYCFFTILGIYLFIRGLSNQKAIFFITSSASTLLASWSRIEGISIFIVSIFILMFFNKNNRLKSTLWYSAPLLIILIAFISNFSEIKPVIQRHSRLNAIQQHILLPYTSYLDIRQEIHEIILNHQDFKLRDFLKEARTNIWLISLGMFANRLAEAVFFPFLPFFVVGFVKFWKTSKKEIAANYLMFLIISGSAVIYYYMVSTWTLEIRRFIIILIPSCLICATGIHTISKYMASKLRIKEFTALCFIMCFILSAGLLKNIKPRETDKAVFKTIGQFIAGREETEKPIQISASLHIQRWISYYANQDYSGTFCPEYTEKNCWELFPESTCDGFINHLERENLRYFLWAEHRWTAKGIDVSCIEQSNRFEELGQWTHPDTGKMVLYRTHFR